MQSCGGGGLVYERIAGPQALFKSIGGKGRRKKNDSSALCCVSCRWLKLWRKAIVCQALWTARLHSTSSCSTAGRRTATAGPSLTRLSACWTSLSVTQAAWRRWWMHQAGTNSGQSHFSDPCLNTCPWSWIITYYLVCEHLRVGVLPASLCPGELPQINFFC